MPPDDASLVRLALRFWRVRVALALTAALALACWGNALADHLGFGAALVCAVTTSLLGALAGTALPRAARKRSTATSGASLAAHALGLGLALVGLFVALVAVRALWAPACTPARGLLAFALIAVPGAVLATVVGALLDAALPSRPRTATALALALEPAFVLWALARFYASPAVFSYDPFFGFYPGVYYDEVIALDSTLVTYRLGTLAWLVVATLLLVAGFQPEKRVFSARALPRSALPWLGLALAVGLGVYAAGPSLGHRASAPEIAAALGGRVTSRRCTVLYDRTLELREARALALECDFRVERLERFFALGNTGGVTVFLFTDTLQKRRWMGAADTYIAKPWRREIYLQREGSLTVLEHELAHVVTGALAPGPLHLAAFLRVIPLPGLVEGAAVAAAWEGDSDASPHQWSRAMLDAGQLPPMAALMGTGFLAHASGTAYTAAGSFSRFLLERYGPARYGRVYRDGDFVAAYGQPLGTLEAQWRTMLAQVTVPERLRTRARTRFRRAALGARLCPHETAELGDRAAEALHNAQLVTARDAYRTVLTNDPTDLVARVGLVEALVRNGEVGALPAALEDAQRVLGPAAVNRLRQRVGDALWRWRSPEAAREAYAQVEPGLFDEDEARTVELKRWALGLGPGEPPVEARDALRTLLLGTGNLEPDSTSALGGLWLADASAPPSVRALALYLLARHLERRERYGEMAALVPRLDPSALPTERTRREWSRMRAVALARTGQWDDALRAWRALTDDTERPQGQRDTSRVWLERVPWLRAHNGG